MRSAGFTLPELLVSVLLFAIVGAALTALQIAFLRDHPRTLAESAVQAEATRAGRALRQAAEEASWIEVPPPDEGSLTAMTLWRNLNPRTNAPLVTGRPARYAHFCLSGDAQLYLYEGDAPLPAIDCAITPDGTLLAGDPSRNLGVTVLFLRPLGERNLLQISYSVRIEATPTHPAFEVTETAQVIVRTGRDL